MNTLSSTFVGILALIVAGAVVFGFFVLIRQFVHWYWRVGEAIELLERQARAAERTAAAVEEMVALARPGR